MLIAKYGAGIDAFDTFGCNALHSTIDFRNNDMVGFLLSRGADVSVYSCTSALSGLLLR
ncbi:hypothetical protein BDD12DRAFT_844157 [Trichophaea hybrida]|nr:hypothetical protein BDD12DRAFT_844157 [Trichophaea hybrida]